MASEAGIISTSELLANSNLLEHAASTTKEEHGNKQRTDSSDKQQGVPANDTSKQQHNCQITATTNNNNNHIIKQNGNQKQQQVNEPTVISASPSERAESCPNGPSETREQPALSAKEFEQLAKEAQEMKIKTRKLQLEIDEKNEIISVLRDELETTREQSDKFQRDNIQLLKDSKRVKFLQDENDFLQDKVGNVDKLELELKRLKEKLAELDFLKLRIGELEEDKSRAQEESVEFEAKWRRAEQGLARVAELEAELDRWKSFSHELESERSAMKAKLLESIDQEAKLSLTNKKVEDEVRRLRSLVRSLEEEREEEQASNSLIMSVADLKQLEQHGDSVLDANNTADSSIKFELDKQIEKGLTEENRSLKHKLEEQEAKLSGLIKSNREICEELNGNKKLISDLRQDLACEKNLALKLSKQLTSFERHIKNLDKQYFHSHLNVGSAKQSADTKEEKSLPYINLTSSATRQFHQSSGESRSTGENDTSLLKSVTLESEKDALLVSEINSIDKAEASNKSTKDNETQTVQNKMQDDSIKLSAQSEEKEVATRTKLPIQLDKCNELINSNGEYPASEEERPKLRGAVVVGNLLKLAPVPGQIKAETCVVTNKSSATLEILNNKDEDRAHTKDGLLPTTGTNNNTTSASCELGAQLESPAETLSSSPLIDSADEQFNADESRKNVNGYGFSVCGSKQRNDNGDAAQPIQLLTSVSSAPATNCSQSLSAPEIVGHDSGFQSINNDFNQISPPNARRNSVAQLSSSTAVVTAKSNEKAVADGKQITPLPANRSTPAGQQNVASASTDSTITTVPAANSLINSEAAVNTRLLSTPTQFMDKVPHATATRDSNPFSGQQQQQLINGSQRHKSIATSSGQAAVTTSPSKAKPVHATNKQIDSKPSDNRAKHPARRPVNHDKDDDEDESGDNLVNVDQAKAHSNFVRNSLSSRSVNFGHLGRSSYLDRIRASVTATATTNTCSSFNQQQSQNIFIAQGPKNEAHQSPHHRCPARLICMLDHQHLNGCFAVDSYPPMHSSQLHPHYQHLHHHQHPNASVNEEGVRTSRQLNALIDPAVSHELLVQQQQQQQQQMMQQQSMIPQRPQGIPVDTTSLTEQQMTHLAHQHYYHHLEHLRQLHQMHHQHHLHLQHHRLHHKYQQQHSPTSPASGKLSGSSQSSTSSTQQRQQEDGFINQSTHVRQREPSYTGGSQFYAPSMQLEQVYANISTNNNIHQANEPPTSSHHHHRTGLVNSANSTEHAKTLEPNCLGSSPNKQLHQNIKLGGAGSAHKTQVSNQCVLPQIDEVNGLPTVLDEQLCKSRTPSSQSGVIQRPTNGKDDESRRASTMTSPSNNASPSSNSSSPTSSNSSNLSPSSASSSSSLNSLTASNNYHLSRSALRHTTIDLSRRKFSVERELSSIAPMTATLSRVGSCRANDKMHEATGNYIIAEPNHGSATVQRPQINLSAETTQMRTPVKSSQPSMRTSKILNIGHQSNAQSPTKQHQTTTLQQQHHNQVSQQQQHDQLAHRRSSLKGSGLGLVDSKLASNLAGIRLNDSLAFTSLRVPKGTPRASGLNSLDRQQVANGHRGHSSSGLMRSLSKKPALSSSSSEKQQSTIGTNQTNDQASNKSSVWFEYGCV